jgi:hypothetical protein
MIMITAFNNSGIWLWYQTYLWYRRGNRNRLKT